MVFQRCDAGLKTGARISLYKNSATIYSAGGFSGFAIYLPACACVRHRNFYARRKRNHNKVLHERIVFLTVHILGIPWVAAADRIQVRELRAGYYQLDIRYDFKDEPDIPLALTLAAQHGLQFEMMETSFFISRQTFILTAKSGWRKWHEHLFSTMSHNSRHATDYYRIPSNRVISLGS